MIILYIFAFLSCTLAGIPYKNIDFILMNDYPLVLEARINESLRTTKSFFQRKEVEVTVIGDTKVLKFVPYIGPIVAALPIIQDAFGTEWEWKRKLSRAFQDVRQRAQAEADILAMESSMRAIRRNIDNLDPHRNLSIDSKMSLVHDVHTGLCNIVSKFAQRQSVFRKHPLVGLPILLALSSFVSLFVHMESVFVPDIARGSLVSCKLYKTLFEYRQLAVESRLNKLEIIDSMGTKINKRQPISQVLGKAFNEYGYNQTMDTSIRCRKGCRPFEGEYVYVCLMDPVSRTEYDCHMRHEMYGCLFGYMEFVRHRVEKVFTDPIGLLAKTCSDEARNSPGLPTPTVPCFDEGYGWWTIMFHGAEAHTDIHGTTCDDWGSCDAYLKLLIDGKEVYRTECKVNSHMPYFGETYRSQRIHKFSQVTIEMWDEDSGWIGSPDALMLRWETNIEALLQNGIKWGERGSWKNKIVTASSWKDEYPDVTFPMILA